MKGLKAKIREIREQALQYVRETVSPKQERILVNAGETVVVEGGPSTGKTDLLRKTAQQLNDAGNQTLLINAALPVTDWAKDFRLFGRNFDARIEYLLRTMSDNFYLLLDNAEKITDSRKLEAALLLLEKTQGALVSCSSFNHLIGKLRVRLAEARIHSLGTGTNTFDITYIVIACLIIFVALMGAHRLIFLAAAMRYMFQGARIGGRNI